MGYYKPCARDIKPGQRFGANPGWGPNPPGGHNGNDELAPVGTPVHAAGDGVVVFAGQFDSTYADNFGWNLNFGGLMVVLNLDGDAGPYVEYGHNSKLLVSAGDRVRAGQVIALSGATDGGSGVITGPHVHVGVLPPNFDLNTPTYGRVNPDLYLTEYPDEITGSLSYASESITPVQEDDMTPEERKTLFEVLDKINGNTDALPKQQYWNDLINAVARVDASASAPQIAAQLNAAGLAASVRDELVKLIGGAK